MTKNTIRNIVRPLVAGLALATAYVAVHEPAALSASEPVVLYGYYQQVPNIAPPTRLDIAMPGSWSVRRQTVTCEDMGGTVGPELAGRQFGKRCKGVDY